MLEIRNEERIMSMQTKGQARIVVMVDGNLGAEAGAKDLPGFPTPAERLALGKWMARLVSRKPPRISFLDGAVEPIEEDIVISLDRNKTSVAINVGLTDDETVGLMRVVLDLAAARGFTGKLVIDRLFVRPAGVNGIKRLGRMKVTALAGMNAA
jgi:hypothetical protein